MKILFICGSLEPGYDGVGDYTRRLAGELIRQGNEAQIVAINDKNVTRIAYQEQEDDSTLIPCLRLPQNIHWKNRMMEAGAFLDIFNPDWLSLQYVPFAFQNRGLHFGLVEKLKTLANGRNWHIMFHELWVGIERESSLKMKLWGRAQQLLILHMLRKLKPGRIGTQMQIYKALLNNLGYNKVSLLPLFSNIPGSDTIKRTPDPTYYTCVLFGSIHNSAPVNIFIKELKECCQKARSLRFVFIGRCGEGIKEWISVLEEHKIPYTVAGECVATKISHYLNEADLGISTTPWYLVEKSGTVAAMLSHSLPVLCVSRPWTPMLHIDDIKINSIICYQAGRLKDLLPVGTSAENFNDLKDISTLFIKDLK